MMHRNLLLVTNKPQSTWIKTLMQSVKPLGILQIVMEKDAWREIEDKNFDIVILDTLGIRDISQFVRQHRILRPEIPIVVAAHSRTWRYAYEVMKAGAADYFLKTISSEQIVAMLTSLLTKPESSLEVNTTKDTLLFADNDPEYLTTIKELLEREGYSVITAITPSEARQKLETGGIDLAILDIRLKDDDDEKDVSGLSLAMNFARTIPKILITSYPSYEYVREALRPQLDGVPMVKDFVSRQDGYLALLETIADILKSTKAQKEGVQPKKQIFVAHGHDLVTKDILVEVLRGFGLQPIVLTAEADRGDTIIEKFERYSNSANFAIALFTCDDIGYSNKEPTQVRPRARQNVIFELGYFLAKLGRRRVRILYQDGVEIPSNILGFLYIRMDEQGKWKEQLYRELKDAGLPVTSVISLR